MLEQIYFENNGGQFTYVWENSTFFLYLFFLIIACILGYYAQPMKRDDNDNLILEFNNRMYYIVFVFLYVFYAFRDITVGRDTEMYTRIFNDSVDWNNIEDWNIEPGFFFLNRVFRLFFDNDSWGVIIFSTITLILIFKTIYKKRYEIDVQMALFLFVGIGFFFFFFNLLRISLATSIELFFFHYVIEKQYFKYFIVLVLCMTIHYTTMLMFVPFFSLILYRKNPKYFFILLVILALIASYVISHLENFILFARYEHYTLEDVEKVGLGMAQFVYNIPVLLLAYYIMKREYCSTNVLEIIVVYTSFCFLYGIVGYYIPVGRAVIHFLMIYLLLIPYCFVLLRNNEDRYYRVLWLGFILYGIVRFHYYLKDYLYSDGIMPYRMLDLW